ncbi:MAG: hypothetical protein JWO94_277, partial [Verrucomicrobiaceae bacterium]|nr:hypothetical protein [Verrucomicrobiaceae bacterium]
AHVKIHSDYSMSRIIGFLIILGGIAGTYFVYQDYAAKQKDRHNRFADTIRGLIQDHGTGTQLDGQDAPWLGNDGSFFRILGQMNDAERHVYSVGDTVKIAASSAGLRPGESKMVVDMLMENYHIAKQLGVFDDLSNMLRLEHGEPPVSQAHGWENETLTVGHSLSPVVAPEASLSFVNLVLMPKCMRDLQNEDLNGFTPDMAKKWLSERIITPDSYQTIIDILSAKKF